jgi:hypothetical protein
MSADRTATIAPPLQAGKLAFEALVTAFGGQEAASAETGKSQPRICDYGRPNVAAYAPLDVIDTLEARTHGTEGWPHVTRWFCRRRGGIFMPLPEARVTGIRWTLLIAELGKEAGQLTHGVCSDLEDNEISPAEARRRLKDAGDLVRVAVELEAALKARAEENE